MRNNECCWGIYWALDGIIAVDTHDDVGGPADQSVTDMDLCVHLSTSDITAARDLAQHALHPALQDYAAVLGH